CAISTTFFVTATFSSNDSIDLSIITDVKPLWIATTACSNEAPWSQWIATGTDEDFARSMIDGRNARVVCRSSFGWMATMSGAPSSSEMSMMPVNIAQSLMLKAGTAKLLSWAAAWIGEPVTGMGDGTPCGLRGVAREWASDLDRDGGQTTDEVPLEEQEQQQHGEAAHDAHREHLVPLVGVLTHEELDADRHRAHVLRARQREREQELVPRDHERVDAHRDQARDGDREQHAPQRRPAAGA